MKKRSWNDEETILELHHHRTDCTDTSSAKFLLYSTKMGLFRRLREIPKKNSCAPTALGCCVAASRWEWPAPYVIHVSTPRLATISHDPHNQHNYTIRVTFAIVEHENCTDMIIPHGCHVVHGYTTRMGGKSYWSHVLICYQHRILVGNKHDFYPTRTISTPCHCHLNRYQRQTHFT